MANKLANRRGAIWPADFGLGAIRRKQGECPGDSSQWHAGTATYHRRNDGSPPQSSNGHRPGNRTTRPKRHQVTISGPGESAFPRPSAHQPKLDCNASQQQGSCLWYRYQQRRVQPRGRSLPARRCSLLRSEDLQRLAKSRRTLKIPVPACFATGITRVPIKQCCLLIQIPKGLSREKRHERQSSKSRTVNVSA
jgi:hypothetical protein